MHKKTVTLSPLTDETSVKVVSIHVASDIAQNLNGTLNGFSLTTGTKPFTGLALSRNQQILFDSAPKIQGSKNIAYATSTCNFRLDSSINKTVKLRDTIFINVIGLVTSKVLCANNVPAGVTVIDTFRISGVTPSYNYTSIVKENIFIQKLTAADGSAQTSLNGDLNIKNYFNYKGGVDSQEVYDYIFTNCIVNSAGDIISGKAATATIISSQNVTKNYPLVITFTGNHKAQLNLNNLMFNIDLTTGLLTL